MSKVQLGGDALLNPAEQPVEVVPKIVARYGDTTLLEFPKGLYIPPAALHLFLESFEGPLDLLLYLIRKDNLDILEVSVSQVTQQYIAYVFNLPDSQRYLISEYLLMSAMLIQIKSRILLPVIAASTQEEESESHLGRSLVEKIKRYETFKTASIKLFCMPIKGRDFWRISVPILPTQEKKRLPNIHLKDLQKVWESLLKRLTAVEKLKISLTPSLSIRENMSSILLKLEASKTPLCFSDIVDNLSKPQMIVTFLSILQLLREGLIVVCQSDDIPDAMMMISKKSMNQSEDIHAEPSNQAQNYELSCS